MNGCAPGCAYMYGSFTLGTIFCATPCFRSQPATAVLPHFSMPEMKMKCGILVVFIGSCFQAGKILIGFSNEGEWKVQEAIFPVYCLEILG